MPASDLLELADRWRRRGDDPAGAQRLVAIAGDALAELSSPERGAIMSALRRRGAHDLAAQVRLLGRGQANRQQVLETAYRVLTSDDETLRTIATQLTGVPPREEPVVASPPPGVADPPRPPAPAGAPLPPPPEFTQPPAAEPPLATPDPEPPPHPQPETWPEPPPDLPPDPEPEPEQEPEPDLGRGPAPDPAPEPEPEPVRAPPRQQPPREESAATAVWAATTARQRLAAVRDSVAAAPRTEDVTDLLGAVPAGWQRRRAAISVLDRVAAVDVGAVLSLLDRVGDRTAVADRLLRGGLASIADIAPFLPDAVVRRLRRRHAG